MSAYRVLFSSKLLDRLLNCFDGMSYWSGYVSVLCVRAGSKFNYRFTCLWRIYLS